MVSVRGHTETFKRYIQGMGVAEKTEPTVQEKIKEITVLVICGVPVLSGVGIVIYQVFFWLYNGEWFSLPISTILFSKTFFSFYPDFIVSWFTEPQSWLGLHKVIVWLLHLLLQIPLSISLILTGLYVVPFFLEVVEDMFKVQVEDKNKT